MYRFPHLLQSHLMTMRSRGRCTCTRRSTSSCMRRLQVGGGVQATHTQHNTNCNQPVCAVGRLSDTTATVATAASKQPQLEQAPGSKLHCRPLTCYSCMNSSNPRQCIVLCGSCVCWLVCWAHGAAVLSCVLQAPCLTCCCAPSVCRAPQARGSAVKSFTMMDSCIQVGTGLTAAHQLTLALNAGCSGVLLVLRQTCHGLASSCFR